MAAAGSLADIVLKKYAKDTGNEVVYIPPVSEEIHDNDVVNLGLTPTQYFELAEAFNMIAGEGNTTIPEDKISDLFDSVGYTLQESDLKWIINNTTSQKDGTYVFDMIAESFSDWKKEQINVEDVKAVFNMFASGKKFSMNFPTTFSGEPGSNTIKSDAIKYVLSETIKQNLPNTSADVERIIDEISTSNDRGITFKDFVGLFSK